MLKLLLYPNDVLNKVCDEISTDEILEHINKGHIKEMQRLCRSNRGAALAAPQVGILKRFYVTPHCAFFNPTWEPHYTGTQLLSSSVFVEEGCLSFPGLFMRRKRFLSISLEYYDSHGIFHKEVLEGFDAQVAQHEVEHLNGHLLIDGDK